MLIPRVDARFHDLASDFSGLEEDDELGFEYWKLLITFFSEEYLQILAELVKIAKAQPSLVSAIGLCNFDTEHTVEACEYLLANLGEVGIVSNQVQVSI